MKKTKREGDPNLHPIQMVSLGVRELFIKSNRPPDLSLGIDPQACSINVSTTPYSKKEKRFLVILKLESGMGDDKAEAPYAMRIELIGTFEVDEAGFKVEHVADWAMKGAPLVMFPYLREQALGLSLRCGFRPLMLPLLQVQTFTIEKPKRRAKK